MSWVYDDGGRAQAGFKGNTGDCVTRAIAITTGISYIEVYKELSVRQKTYANKKRKNNNNSSSARTGIHKSVEKKFLSDIGWLWTPTMFIGQGCKVHLRADELPSGTLIAYVSRHSCAVIDGIIHDTYDPSRDGTRCVYGYFTKG